MIPHARELAHGLCLVGHLCLPLTLLYREGRSHRLTFLLSWEALPWIFQGLGAKQSFPLRRQIHILAPAVFGAGLQALELTGDPTGLAGSATPIFP